MIRTSSLLIPTDRLIRLFVVRTMLRALFQIELHQDDLDQALAQFICSVLGNLPTPAVAAVWDHPDPDKEVQKFSIRWLEKF